MLLKLEQPFAPTSSLSEQTKRVCKLIDVDGIAERFPAETTDYLINAIIDVSLQVWVDARENPQISPKARRVQKEQLFEKYCLELNLDIVKEVFIDDSVQALGNNVADDLIARRKEVAEDFAESVEESVRLKIDSLMKKAEELGSDSTAVEYQDVAQDLLSFGVKIDVPESSKPTTSSQTEQVSAEPIKIRMNFAPSKGMVIKLVASTALAATVVGVGATSAAADERHPVPVSSSSSLVNQDSSIPSEAAASPSTETASAEVQPVVGVEPSDTIPSDVPTAAPTDAQTSNSGPGDSQGSPSISPSEVSVPSQEPETAPPATPDVVVPPQEPETAPPATVFTQQAALPLDTSIAEAANAIQHEAPPVEAVAASKPGELSDVAARLIPEMADVPNKLSAVLADGNITGFGRDTAFNQNDPANPNQVLKMIISSEQQAAIKVQADDINKVLSGDKETIDRLLQYYSTQSIDQDTYGQIADYIVTLKFVKDDGPDLSIEQKILLVRLYSTVHDALSADADAIYAKAVKDYEANKPKVAGPDVKQATPNNSANMSIDQNALAQIKTLAQNEVDKIPNRSQDQKALLYRMIVATAAVKQQSGVPNFNAPVADAQLLVESGWGKDDIAAKYNNYFGVKAGSSWKGEKVLLPTWEQKTNGEKVKIMAYFRVYDSMEASLADRLIRLGSLPHFKDASNCYESVDSYIDGLLNKVDAKCQIIGAHENPYATDQAYKETLKSIIKANHLEEIYSRIEVIGRQDKKSSKSKNTQVSQYPKVLPDGTYYVSQHDPEWANDSYNKSNGEHRTISQSGCEPTTAAWVLRTLGVDKNATPVEQARANQKNGGRSSSLEAVREMAKEYGLHVENISSKSTQDRVDAIVHALSINPDTGRPFGVVMASGQDASASDPAPFTSAGHVLGIYRVKPNGSVKVMDPNSLRKSKVWWNENQIIARASYIYIISN